MSSVFLQKSADESMTAVFTVSSETVLLNIKAVPGASRSQFAGIREDRLGVKIAAPPEDGKANAELCVFLAKSLGCPKKDVSLKAGEKSRLKTVSLPLSTKEKLEALLKNL